MPEPVRATAAAAGGVDASKIARAIASRRSAVCERAAVAAALFRIVGLHDREPGLAAIGDERRVIGIPYEVRAVERRAQLEAAVVRFVDIARRYPDVRAVYVFGSLARENVGPRSDLDLLVVRETTLRGPRRGEDLAMDASLGIEYDLLVLTPSEYAAPGHSSFWRDVIAEARLRYAA